MTVAANLSDLLFGCWHRHLSFPRTVKRGEPRPPAAWRTGTYVVCLECGKEFPYDWEEMRIVPLSGRSAEAQHSYGRRAA